VPPRRLDASAPGFETEFSAFLGRNRDSDENVGRVVAERTTMRFQQVDMA